MQRGPDRLPRVLLLVGFGGCLLCLARCPPCDRLLPLPPLTGANWSHAGFDSQQWYQQLFDYGMPQDPSDLDPTDPDANLVPQLVQVRA